MKTIKTIDFGDLKHDLPPVIWRSRWNALADRHGLPYRRSYMEDLDSKGLGPKKAVMNGRVAYRREDVVMWLNSILKENM